MFGQNPNSMGGGNGVNHNSFLRNLVSEGSMTSLSLWNRNLSIKIRPAVGRDGNGIIQYDKNRQGQTALTPDNAYALYEQLEAEILPEYRESRENNLPCATKAVSVQTTGAAKNIITIRMEPGNNPENASQIFILEVALSVDDQDVAQAGNIYRHEFARKKSFAGYNPALGTHAPYQEINADFDYFVRVLREVGNEDVKDIVFEHSKQYNEMRSAASGAASGYSGGGFNSAPPANNGFFNGGELPFT